MNNRTPRFFIQLGLITALLTVGLIVFGAFVRVTDSGLGCGNAWPLCDGRVVPPLDNLTAWIEWSHRLFAALIGLFGLAMLTFAWRKLRDQNRMAFMATVAGALLFIVQSLLGAAVVIMDLPPTMVTLHLGTAMLLLAALLIAAIAAWHQPSAGAKITARDHVTLLAYTTTILSLIIILSGALVRGSGATLACDDWPLCNGSAFPFDQGQLETVHMLHRFAVVGLGLSLLLLVWYVYQDRSDRLLRRLAVAAVIAYFSQALVGAFYVWTSAAPFWGAAHVGVASLTWAFLVAVSTIDTLNSGVVTPVENGQDMPKWSPQSEVTDRP